jgi:hypothetical protein
MGLELQIEELIEERTRAQVQGRGADVATLDREIAQLQAELATTAEKIAEEGPEPPVAPQMHNAEELSASDH